MALANRPRASGAAIRYITLRPPADSPAIVTLRRIAAERGDVALHPAQRRDLVEQAVVAGDVPRRLRAQRGMREIAEHAEAIVDRDDDHAALGEARAVVQRLAAGARDERAAVDPDEHRRLARLGGRPDVERQAVLAHRRQIPGVDAARPAAWAARTPGRTASPRACPSIAGAGSGGFQRSGADRRQRVRNALEARERADGLAPQRAGRRIDDGRRVGGRRQATDSTRHDAAPATRIEHAITDASASILVASARAPATESSSTAST